MPTPTPIPILERVVRTGSGVGVAVFSAAGMAVYVFVCGEVGSPGFEG